MRIAVLCFGSRGDVQPGLALALGLAARGHEVWIAAPDNFGDWVERHGVAFRPIGVDVEALLRSEELRRMIAGNWLALGKIWRGTVVPMMRRTLEATWHVARDAELIVYHPKLETAVDVAEATGALAVCASPIPIFATGEFPFPVWTRGLGPWLNRRSYALMNGARVVYAGLIARWREEMLGLPRKRLPTRGREPWSPGLLAASPSVLARPADYDSAVHVTGYWFLDEGDGWQPDPGLADFLDRGPPPVYVGFGSMTTRDPAGLARTVVEGVRRAGVRAILATGWGALEALEVPDTVHVIDQAPHDALFRHVDAVVHHGGAGTTGAGLRAGLPTLVCPLIVDQPFWGERVHALGLGPAPRRLRRLRAEPFARALRELTGNASYRRGAERVASAIAAEDGVARAVDIIESLGRDRQE